MGAQAAHPANEKVPEGLMASPSGGPNGSTTSPWDKNSVAFSVGVRLTPTGFRHGSVTGRAVVASLHHERGTNATARSRNVSACSTAGRRLNANVGCGAKQNSGNSTPPPNGSVVVANVSHGRPWST
jgi:hypothetical protein